jgi:hypothetical protein
MHRTMWSQRTSVMVIASRWSLDSLAADRAAPMRAAPLPTVGCVSSVLVGYMQRLMCHTRHHEFKIVRLGMTLRAQFKLWERPHICATTASLTKCSLLIPWVAPRAALLSTPPSAR